MPLLALPARLFAAVPALCLALAAVPAAAGGGAHVVDDDAVLDPGVCHNESWLTLAGDRPRRGLAVAAPACTFRQLPGLELALGVQHAWDNGSATGIAPAAKYNILPAANGFGLAVSGTATVSADTGRVESYALAVPITVPVQENLLLHANLGWIGEPGGSDQHALFWGGHIEYHAARNLQLMAEVFGRDRGAAGAQAGLRWVRDHGRIDLDLIAGHNIDGSGASSVTIGITIRR